MTDKIATRTPLDVLPWRGWLLPGRPEVLVDRRAFLIALIGAPVIVGACGAVLVIPGLAVLLGLPATLVVGGPVAWWTISRFGAADGTIGAGQMALAGAFAVGITTLLVVLWQILDHGAVDRALSETWLVMVFGLIIALLQGVVLAALYNWKVRPQAVLHRMYREWIIDRRNG